MTLAEFAPDPAKAGAASSFARPARDRAVDRDGDELSPAAVDADHAGPRRSPRYELTRCAPTRTAMIDARYRFYSYGDAMAIVCIVASSRCRGHACAGIRTPLSISELGAALRAPGTFVTPRATGDVRHAGVHGRSARWRR